MLPIKILICEDELDKREYLRQLLGGYDAFELAGEFASGEEAVRHAPELAPDVVIMDVGLPGISGIESTRQIKEMLPHTQIVMYTVFEDDDRLFDSLCAGAMGYMLKNTQPHRLLEAIQEVVTGGSPMSPGIARKVIRQFQQNKGRQEYNLTERELVVLKYLVDGDPIKVIAGKVYLSEDGVKKRLRNIYLKLHVNCGKEAVAKAVRERIV